MAAFERAIQLHGAGDTAGAKVQYVTTIRQQPRHAAAYSNLAVLLQAEGRESEALHASGVLALSS